MNALAALGMLVALHVGTYRFIAAGNVLTWLKKIAVISAVGNVLLSGMTFLGGAAGAESLGLARGLLCAGLSLGIYFLLVFLYILCIFGPHESSVRLRLVRELDKYYPEPCPEKLLKQSYNAQAILRRRLARLQATGDIIFDGQYYRVHKQWNFFVFADQASGFLKRWMNLK